MAFTLHSQNGVENGWVLFALFVFVVVFLTLIENVSYDRAPQFI